MAIELKRQHGGFKQAIISVNGPIHASMKDGLREEILLGARGRERPNGVGGHVLGPESFWSLSLVTLQEMGSVDCVVTQQSVAGPITLS